MDNKQINVEIYTIPQAACDANKANWQQVAQMVVRQIETRFGGKISATHIEFMSPEWFQNETAQNMLASGEVNFPFVLVDGEIACADKKINIPKINKVIQTKINR